MRQVPKALAALAVTVAAGGLLGVRARPAQEAPPRAPRIEVAITVDDLTRPPFEPALEPPVLVVEKLVAAFERHGLPPVTGFETAGRSSNLTDGAALTLGRRGNRSAHTWSHSDLAKVGVGTFLADVDRNEGVLAKYAGRGADWRVFRFPFLQEGPTERAREAMRAQLAARGYRIAEVTIDFEDWQWFPSYARCRSEGSTAGVAELRALYRDAARKELIAADELGRALFGRPIRQILLLHAGSFTAEMIETLLRDYEALGVRFISLDDALEDSAYQLDPRFARSWGTSFLWQVETARGITPPAALAAARRRGSARLRREGTEAGDDAVSRKVGCQSFRIDVTDLRRSARCAVCSLQNARLGGARLRRALIIAKGRVASSTKSAPRKSATASVRRTPALCAPIPRAVHSASVSGTNSQ
jgi:peptidoglycan/xylan/chitin deacetylase (PgdA/CDA1 family)